MSETASTTVTYTPLESGNEESRWIRLEQVQATLPAPPVAAVAGMLDSLYDIEPCDDGMGGGGEEADEANEPSAEQVEEELSILLKSAGQCDQGWWLAAVNVYRTHRQPGYELRSETARVQTVRQVTESYSQVVDVDGPQIALERPYAGRLSGIPRGVNWEVRGATVNLDRPVHDRLILRYQTKYERVTLRVPTLRTDEGEEYEPAAVVAFWGSMAAECELEPPEPESDEDREARESICRKRRPEPSEPDGCWKTVRHYYRCECSNRQVDEWEEQVPAPCDGRGSGASVGNELSFDGYTGCGEREDVYDPEFYKQRCCEYPRPPASLPRCREMRRVYRGGHVIESGPEYWKNIYGENVIMRPVLPEGGVCGDEITRWNVPQKDCCADVIPLSPAPGNPLVIQPGHGYEVKVLDGKPNTLLHWKAYGGIEFGPGVTEIENGGRQVHIQARADVCPAPRITVDDGCHPLEMIFEGEAGPAPELPNDVIAAPESRFVLEVGGGIPPFAWQLGSGLTLEATSLDGRRAIIKTGQANTWCVDTATAIDTCGRVTTAYVRNSTKGKWVPHDQFDRCAPMTGGGLITPIDTTGGVVYGYLNGYRYRVTLRNSYTAPGGCPSLQPCGSGLILTTNGEELITLRCREIPAFRYEAGCGCVGTIDTRTHRSAWGQYIQMVWEWYCGGEGT